VHFCVSTCAQEALARVLVQAQTKPYEGHANYYAYLRHLYRSKRTALVNACETSGLIPIIPDGGFFIMAHTGLIPAHPTRQPAGAGVDTNDIGVYARPSAASGPVVGRDWAMCRFLTEHVGVAAIPPSAFCSQAHTSEVMQNFVRLAFCKSDEAIQEAGKRLQASYDCDHNGPPRTNQ
jgi:aspartate/methionine/tyrosine aminotransferase